MQAFSPTPVTVQLNMPMACCYAALQEPEPSECESVPRDGTSDKPLFRLFVGWVPKLFTEQDLLPLFKKVGGGMSSLSS